MFANVADEQVSFIPPLAFYLQARLLITLSINLEISNYCPDFVGLGTPDDPRAEETDHQVRSGRQEERGDEEQMGGSAYQVSPNVCQSKLQNLNPPLATYSDT
jgi:hypothetical protein